MEQFIQITFILLILSMITEKITNLLKLHASDYFKSGDSKKDEKRIQILSIGVGILVGILCKANIFKIYLDPEFELFWKQGEFDFSRDFFADLLGCIFAGFFLSLGSKFFHDLLDLLLQAKNLKRKLVSRDKWDFHKIKDVDEYIRENELGTIDAFLANYFGQFPEVSAWEYVEESNEIQVVLRSTVSDLPKTVPVKLKSGPTLLLPVVVQFAD